MLKAKIPILQDPKVLEFVKNNKPYCEIRCELGVLSFYREIIDYLCDSKLFVVVEGFNSNYREVSAFLNPLGNLYEAVSDILVCTFPEYFDLDSDDYCLGIPRNTFVRKLPDTSFEYDVILSDEYRRLMKSESLRILQEEKEESETSEDN